jgi:MFS family permease
MNESAASPSAPPVAGAGRARWGVGIVFFVNGAAFASWVSRIPALRAGLHLSDGTLGSVLFAMSCGVLLAFPLAARGARWIGARQLALLAGLVTLLMLPVPFMIGIVPSLVLVMLEMGAASGAMQVAMNVLAVDVQTRLGRPIMSSLHGLWSAGGLVGAGLGSLAAHAGLTPVLHLVAVAATLGLALLCALLMFSRAALPARPQPAPLPARPSMSFPRRGGGLDRVLLGLGIVCFCAFLTEGALADWSAVWLHDKVRASESLAALGYALFAGAMTGMRLLGDRLLSNFGTTRLLRAFTALGGFALAGALVLDRVDAAMTAFILLGLGLATVVPSAFSAAARRAEVLAGGVGDDATSARAVAFLSAFGYTGLLVGPPLIGWLAQAFELRWAMGLLVLLVGAIAWLVPLLDPRRATTRAMAGTAAGGVATAVR